ncbi:MAG: hypothetical protein U1F66_02600 [bacterium]
MTQQEFQKYLQLYGADWKDWPEALRAAGKQAAALFPQLWEEERRFETMLRQAETIPAPGGLAERILKASRGLPQAEAASVQGLRDWLQSLWQPKPALALVSLLVIGFVAGFWLRGDLSTKGGSQELASLLYNEEQVLW